jgi:hypothetical protein
VVHAVIAGLAPYASRIDLTHQIPPHDIWAGALALWRAAPWLAPGVVLAVVDPGVGSERRAVAIRIADADVVLIGPDNGLLLPAAHRLGPITQAVALAADPAAPTESPVLTTAGATFAGRDIFAPAAGRIAAGAPIESLGPLIDPRSLIGRPVPTAQVDPAGTITAEVLWIDRYGNAQLSAGPDDIGRGPVRMRAGDTETDVRIVSSYAAIGAEDLALVVDSSGLLSICCDQRSAALHLGLNTGDPIRLFRLEQGHR